MNLLKPKYLKKSSKIGFLSVSGSIEDTTRLDKAKKYFEKCGFEVAISCTSYQVDNYMSGPQKHRLDELHKFFEEPSIDAILCTRGGYGSLRLLNEINYDIIKLNPKLFIGYSDITALQLMFFKKAGLITINGPMAYSDFSLEIDKITEKSFFETIESNIKDIPLSNSKIYNKGKAEGILWGGNLATIASLCGQDFIPDEKFIFFVEDALEPVYKIDRMFTQLLNIPQFKENLAGIILGDFSGVDSPKYFDDFFCEIGSKLNIPVKSGLKNGHEKIKLSVPIGVKASFNTDEKKVLILEDYLS